MSHKSIRHFDFYVLTSHDVRCGIRPQFSKQLGNSSLRYDTTRKHSTWCMCPE